MNKHSPSNKREAPKRAKRWFGTRDLMERYGVSDRTLDDWIAKKLIPAPSYIGTRRAWTEEELEQHERLTVRKRAPIARTRTSAPINGDDAAA